MIMDRIATPGADRRFQRIAALFVLSCGATTFVGMLSGIDILIRWFPSSTSMNPITAALMVMSATALLLPRKVERPAMAFTAATMIAAGSFKLLQTALGHPLGIDQLAAIALRHGQSTLPDAMALNTAVTWILLGGATAVGRTSRSSRAILAQSLATVAIAIPVMALVGFTLGATTINDLTYNRMAVNTALGMAALGMAIMALTPHHGIIRLLFDKSPSGALARMALPVCLTVPILLGIVRLRMQAAFGLTTGDGVAIMIVGNIALTLAILWGSLILLMRSDADARSKAAALAVSEAQYRQAGRIGKMGHWQYDVAKDELHWTKEFRVLLGLNPELSPDFAVMNERIHPDDRDQARDMMVRAQTDGKDWNWQLRLLAPDGELRYAKSHGICRRGADGSVYSILGVLADITELETARQVAESATLSQAAFLANMSHEIRTPLNGVIGFVGLVLDSDLDSTQRRYLMLVDESAKTLLTLLNDILDLSKVQAGLLDVAPIATDLSHSVVQAMRLMIPLAEQKSIELSATVDPDFPAAVMIDGARFRQILLNIVGNAVKFTEHGSVAVMLEAAEDANRQPILRAVVTDTGIGIPADRLDAMFKPFVQADSSTSRKFGGSGLGLSISRQLAGLMGGTLSLDSIEGKGTTVELILPLLEARGGETVVDQAHYVRKSSAMPSMGEVVAAASGAQGKSILLVDDLELNRILVAEMLRRLGHRIDFASNGAEALAMAEQLADDPAAWDLILMDVQMPVMNGVDATRAIRALGGAAATIPIIALSANAFEAEIKQSRDSGMDDHVVKPIDFDLLSRTIDYWAEAKAVPRRAVRRA